MTIPIVLFAVVSVAGIVWIGFEAYENSSFGFIETTVSIFAVVAMSALFFLWGGGGKVNTMNFDRQTEAYAAAIEDLESHYDVKLLNDNDNVVNGRNVFTDNHSKFNSITIESGMSRIDGYIFNVEDDTYALVVEEGTESTDEFVEYDTELVSSGDFEEVSG